MKTWTIGKRIIIGFTLVLVITASLGGFSLLRVTHIEDDARRIASDSLPSLDLTAKISQISRDNYAIIFEHIISTDAQEMAALEAGMKDLAQSAGQMWESYEKIVSSPEERALFDKARAQRREFFRVRDEVVLPLSRAMQTAEASAAARDQLLPAYRAYLLTLQGLVDLNRTNGERAGASILTNAGTARSGILIGVASAILLGIGVAFVIIRATTRILREVASSLDDGSEQVAAAAHQVSASSQVLAEGSTEQAASLEEASASLEEMSSMTKKNAEHAQAAKSLAAETRAAAASGTTEMHEMSDAMTAIKASSDNIAKIIKTIDEIAFQTNILALNAAVEAARAGDAGMGFAVVADEVRSLAQRSAQAAKETASKIEDSIQKSAHGVEISGKVAQRLESIAGRTKQVDELIAEIATASAEQTQGIQQVNLTVSQMDKVTQRNAAGAEEGASAAEELSSQAAGLKQSVSSLLELVGGARSTPASKNATGTPKSATTQDATARAAAPAGAAKRKAKRTGAETRDPHLTEHVEARARGNGMPAVPAGGEIHDKFFE